ncbi:MAG: hypothetical protein Q4A32_09400 [Lachnospiraceae bacterium]|nr:hypothetical protein [Lachnospiraceae bacterium]
MMLTPIHEKLPFVKSYDRLDMLWERYPQYHERTTFATLESLLEEHESYGKDFDDVRQEYEENHYEQFLVQLSWSDLAYRHATRGLILESPSLAPNHYVEAFMSQFEALDTDHKACFLFPESYISQFFVIAEVCKRAEAFHPIRNLFPDEEKIHYLAVFDKSNMDDVLLMFHLLYTNPSEDLYGGYSLYDYSLPWYQNHLWEEGIVLRSPYLPDRIAKYQGNLPFYHNPAKTVYIRRNIRHILDSGYFSSELEFFRHLTEVIMPLFHWWYADLALYEEKDGYKTNWRLERTRIRTRLTADGVIKPKWKHELTLFHAVRELYPDTLYQYRPEWLGRQSLDLYIPSLATAIEYQGIQHYHPIEFFGGEEALAQRQELDRKKRKLCEENQVRLVEWPYSEQPTRDAIRNILRID